MYRVNSILPTPSPNLDFVVVARFLFFVDYDLRMRW
jgi:hypothetical protein